MSVLATFYTLPTSQSTALLAAATPETKLIEKKGFLFKRKLEEQIDHFWDFLNRHATEQQSYAFSGTGFCDLDLVLEEKGCMLFDFGNTELASKLSVIRASSIAVFDAPAAQTVLSKLSDLGLKEAEVRNYYQENHPSEYEDPGTEAVLAAYDLCLTWLSKVGDEDIGILMIG